MKVITHKWKRISAGMYLHEQSGILVEQDAVDGDWMVVIPGPREDNAATFTHKAKAQDFVQRFLEYVVYRDFMDVEGG